MLSQGALLPSGTAPAASHPASAPPVSSSGAGIWFAPLPFGWHPDSIVDYGATDYMELFKPHSPWNHVANHVRVFKLYSTAVRRTSGDDLKSIFSGLNRAGIAIALEMGPLTASACGQGVEGFDGADAPELLRRIHDLGGSVRYIAMDEPYFFGSLFDGPSACHWSAEQVAREIVNWKSTVRLIFPNAIVGDIEPLASSATAAIYSDWMATFRTATGAELPFFHLDVDWSRPQWAQEARQIETAARGRGIGFGIIYFGNSDDSSDAAWTEHAAQRMAAFEIEAGGRPDSPIFQSWLHYPQHVLPESEPTSFTGLIEQYLGTRSTLTIERRPAAVGGMEQILGKLTEPSGRPLVGVPVELTVTPLQGPGQFKEYTLTGTVPPGATRGVVGIRSNTEGAEPGPVDIVLYQASYRENNEAKDRVPDGNFSRGLAEWGLSPSAQTRLQGSDRGPGWTLHVTTQAGSPLTINSAFFPLTEGVNYTVTFSARVSQASRGYFTLIFLDQTESSRVRLPFAPVAFHYSAITDSAGSAEWQVPSSALPAQVEAKYSGDAHLWPAVGHLAA